MADVRDVSALQVRSTMTVVAEPTLCWAIRTDDGLLVEPVHQFVAELAANGTSPSTRRSYCHDLLRWLRFCEAIGILVAYGAQAVHERVRAWLHTAMPGEVKIASDTARRLVDRFLFASKIDWAPSEPAMHEFEVPVGSTYEATVFLDVPGEYDRQRKARAGGYAEIDE